MLVWLLWAVNIISCSCLAAAMGKHQRDFFGRALEKKYTHLFKFSGWTLLTLSILTSISVMGPSVGLTTLTCTITFSALAVGLIITYLPLHLVRINTGAALLGVLLLASNWLF